ncbi:hypothetical protein [Clostridium paridis]|uniref:Uncharacterized protein n=1 Tax=Clostridium paridis TaxID=2803863 RepID=A0A937K588_9CLOT|nr:hypothetical protein [Clostridium paridis]MBL4933432.1 hypothetical protein [Clostridium paridis]
MGKKNRTKKERANSEVIKEEKADKSKTKAPALLWICLGIIVYYGGKEMNKESLSVAAGIGILLIAIGVIKAAIYFIKRVRNSNGKLAGK